MSPSPPGPSNVAKNEVNPGNIKPANFIPDKVQVLLLYWENDDTHAIEDINILEKFFKEKCKSELVDKFSIPATDAVVAMEQKLSDIEDLCNREGLALIVAYCGHAGMDFSMDFNEKNFDSEVDIQIYGSQPEPIPGFHEWPWVRPPKISWNLIQNWLRQMDFDVLILMDCCYAASAAAFGDLTDGLGRTEMIVSCGYEQLSPGLTAKPVEPLEDSEEDFGKIQIIPMKIERTALRFFGALAGTMGSFIAAGESFTVRKLHREVLRHILKYNFVHKVQGAPTNTPVYFDLCGTGTTSSITLNAAKPAPPQSQNRAARKTLSQFKHVAKKVDKGKAKENTNDDADPEEMVSEA